MSFRLLDDAALQELLLTTFSKNEKHTSFYHSIKFKLEDTFPVATCEVYEYSADDCSYYFAFKENKLLNRNAILITSEGEFNSDNFLKGLNSIFEEKDIWNDMNNGFLFLAFAKYTDLVASFLMEKKSIRTNRYATYLFYMTEAQEDYVSKYQFPELEPGFELGSANADTEAELITSTWHYGQEGEVKQTKMKLSCFPSAVIRHDGAPIAYEMIDHYGFLNHQFTHEEYRNRGFGRIIELDISKKCLERKYHPYKCVELVRPAVVEYSFKSPYWTVSRDENDELSEFVFLVVEKQNLI